MSIFSKKIEVQEPLPDHIVYLIDTENVRTVWTLLLDRMTENDKIYVFYTMNSGNVSYEDLNGVISSGKNVELIQCHTGKNGLDFQLVSYLGYLIKSNENADYCIISDDSGYDAVIKFWEGRDVDVTRKTAAQVSGKPAKPIKKSIFGTKKSSAKPAPTQNKSNTQSKASSQAKSVAQTKTQSQAKTQSQTKSSVQSNTLTQSKNQTQVKTPAQSKAEAQLQQEALAKSPELPKSDVQPETTQQSKTAQQTKSVAPAAGISAEKLKELLPDEPEEKLAEISRIISKSGGKKGLADIHDEIEKLYRNEKASEVYRIIRQNLNDITA